MILKKDKGDLIAYNSWCGYNYNLKTKEIRTSRAVKQQRKLTSFIRTYQLFS